MMRRHPRLPDAFAPLLPAAAMALLCAAGPAAACPPGDIGNTVKVAKVAGTDIVLEWTLDPGSDSGFRVYALDDRQDLHDAVNRGFIDAAVPIWTPSVTLSGAVAATVAPSLQPAILYYKVVGMCCDNRIEGPQ